MKEICIDVGDSHLWIEFGVGEACFECNEDIPDDEPTLIVDKSNIVHEDDSEYEYCCRKCASRAIDNIIADLRKYIKNLTYLKKTIKVIKDEC